MKQQEKTYLQDSFIQLLVEGRFREPDDIAQWNRLLGLNLIGSEWFCVVITALPPQNDRAEVCINLKKYCDRFLREERWEGYCVIGGSMDVILLLNHYRHFRREDFAVLCATLSKFVNQQIQLGIGRTQIGLDQIHVSTEEAYEALKWYEGSADIADIRDIYSNRNTPHAGTKTDCRRIIEQFRNGSVGEIYTNLALVAEQVRKDTVVQPDAPYPSSIRRTMIELLVEMLHIASDEGVDVDAVIGYVDPYRKIFELQGTPAIIQWVAEVVQRLSEAMCSRKKRIEQTQLEQVKMYINLHISDMELNLASVGQSVGMSPSYFSAFFIREAGIGFKEYVTSERISLAKKMLKETKDSINAISEQCGFLSPSYFISVFKNQTGMTPGAYRKLKN